MKDEKKRLKQEKKARKKGKTVADDDDDDRVPHACQDCQKRKVKAKVMVNGRARSVLSAFLECFVVIGVVCVLDICARVVRSNGRNQARRKMWKR